MRLTRCLARISIFTLLCMLVGGCAGKSVSESLESGSAKVEDVSPTKASEIKNATFLSKSLNHKMRMNIYLPKGYNSQQNYPVLYIIHGYSSSEKSWIIDLGLGAAADKLIEAGKITPLIIVSPQLDNSYGINSTPIYSIANGFNKGMYEDYLYQDVIEYVDTHYSTIANRDARYIGGLSMGGFISLHTAFLHTDLFSKVGGHSPAIFLNDWSTTGGEYGVKSLIYPSDDKRKERDPLILANNLDLSQLKVYLDCGDQDAYKFYEGTEQLYKILQAKKVTVEYHLGKGKHDGDYWKPMLENYLMFYAGKTG